MGKVNKKTIFEIDGEKREFELNLNAMIAFEEETGTSLLEMDVNHDINLIEVRALLWAGLHEKDEDLTLKDVGKMIRPDNMSELVDQLTNAYANIMPDETEEGQSIGNGPGDKKKGKN